MALHEKTLKEKWPEIKLDLQLAWSHLTEDELDRTKGNIKALTKLIQHHYSEGDADKKLSDIFESYDKKEGVL